MGVIKVAFYKIIAEGLCGCPEPVPAQARLLRDGALRLRGGVEHAALPHGGKHVAQP